MKPDPAVYWIKTRRLTLCLLLLWLCTLVGPIWFARELNTISFLGFPLGFYMAAQGSLLIFLAIIWWYNRRMRRIDAEFGHENE